MNDKILENVNLIYKVMNDLHCRFDEETQDEMFFEGLMGLYRGIQTYKEGKTKETTYYYVCIRNSITTKFNHNTRQKRDIKNTISIETPIYGSLLIADVIPNNVDIERQIIEKEQLEVICKVLNSTKNTRFKQYFCEYYGIGTPRKKLREIALKYGVTTHNVNASIKQGIERLKKKVKKEYENKKIN